jgi:hypothetical protein
MRGLERDPARRQPTVTALAEEIAAGLAPSPPASGLLDALKRAVRRQ